MPVPTSSMLAEHRTAPAPEPVASTSTILSSPSPDPSQPSSSSSSGSAPPAMDASRRPSEERDQESQEGRSTRSTPTRTDLTRSQSAGKGGCWTCRVRRKKCDEEREGDSCKTCLRLRIKCLGWGPKRPEWMRDKDKVAEYKAGIKEQLTRAGLIRGQPRTAYQLPSKSIVPSQSGLYTGMPASNGTPPRRASYSDVDLYRAAYANSQIHASGVIPVLPGSANPQDSAMNSFLDPAALSDFYASPTIPVMTTPDLSYDLLGGDLSSLAALTPSIPSTPPMTDATPSHEEYIMYYFNHVRPLQFVFAGNTVTNLLYSMLYAEPRGALSNALCALASLHSARLRITQGIDSPNSIPQRSIPKYYYDSANVQLMNKKTMGGQYSHQDAVAAIYLVSFSILSGGSTNWTHMLEVACEWLSQTGIHEDQNPKLTLMNMSPAARFAAKATMWMDIMSSVTFVQPPRFLSLYRRLFKSGAGYWATTGEHSFECKMDSLTGCPDSTVLAIAEIAALAHWKATEMRNGCLSLRELIRRGDLIEEELKTHPVSSSLDGEKNAAQVADPLLAAGAPGALPVVMGEGPDATAPGDDVRLLVAKVHRENALLYLHTVLNDAHPGVPEIANHVSILADLFRRLPVTDHDRAVVFPMCLVGAITEEPCLRDHLTHRCAAHNDDNVGNMYQIRTYLGSTWSRRQQAVNMHHRRGVPVEWRECMRDRWSNLLLV